MQLISVAIVKMVVIGVLLTGLSVAVIVLSVQNSKLSKKLDNQGENSSNTTLPPIVSTTEDLSLLEPWEREYRLSDDVVPSHYDLYLHPKFLEDGVEPTFTGKVVIDFKIAAKQEYFTVHEKDLNITSALLKRVTGGASVELNVNHFKSERNEFYVFVTNDGATEFVIGDYQLAMEFSGSLNKTDIVGFYMSTYTDTSGLQKLVTSKFEPTYARRAFPCMDEPHKKAKFSIRLVKKADKMAEKWTALSNMDLEDHFTNEPESGLDTEVFRESVEMSTYLACFIISQFQSTPEETIPNSGGKDFPLKVWAQPNAIVNTDEALSAATNSVQFYIDYFKIPYALPKLDLIGIPDFVSGAMEHWGLITFRETNLLVVAGESSRADIQRVHAVIGHEIAHMWFGNLVTMLWWDDLWLNEGFASFMEYKAVNSYQNEVTDLDGTGDWKMLDQFVILDLQPVMALDALTSSHPVIQHVDHPDQITELFDTITYSKGSSVLRMLENFLGVDVFQSGIQKYLNKYQFKNAATPDLWAALQEAYDETEPTVDLNVTRVMNTWTLQMGLPVLNVTMKKGSGTGGTITITQSRFLVSTGNKKQSKAGTDSPYGYKWDIPVTYVVKGQTQINSDWLNMEDDELKISIGQPWIKVNTNQMGFYRVNYDTDLWYMLTVAYLEKDSSLTPVDRSSLLDDAFNLAEAGHLDYSTAFELASALTGEKDYIPWATASACFKKMTPLMRGKLAYKNYMEFLQSKVNQMYCTIDLNEPGPAGHIEIRLELTILDFACSVGHPDCLKNAGEKYSAYITDPDANKINADLRLWAYTYGMQEVGNAQSWEIVWHRYLETTDPQERSKLQRSLACIRDAAVLEMYIELAWNETYVKGQDYFKVLEYISDNPVGTSIVWDYVRVNWPRMVDRYTVNNRYLGNLIPDITKTFDTELKLQEMHDFFAAYPDAGAGANARAQALERVEANIEWVKTYYPVVADWLDKSSSPGPKLELTCGP